MNIRLARPMTKLLLEVAEKYGVDTDSLLRGGGVWCLSDETREVLINAISQEFSATGLQLNDEPNGRGLQLEALLDRINRLD